MYSNATIIDQQVLDNKKYEEIEMVDMTEKYTERSYHTSDLNSVLYEVQPTTSQNDLCDSKSINSKASFVYDDFSSDYFSSDSEDKKQDITTTHAQIHASSFCTDKNVVTDENSQQIEDTVTYAVVNKKHNND